MGIKDNFTPVKQILGQIRQVYERRIEKEKIKMTNQPVHKFRAGKISMTAWQGKIGLTWTIRKDYFDKKTNEWKKSETLFPEDIDSIVEVCKQALAVMAKTGKTVAPQVQQRLAGITPGSVRHQGPPPPPPPADDYPPGYDAPVTPVVDDDDIPF